MTFKEQNSTSLIPVVQQEVDGVEMGVMGDGAPFLTSRGLAKLCGVDHTAIIHMVARWETARTKPRGQKLLSLLKAQGHSGYSLASKIKVDGVFVNAHTDAVVMAVLEYYAFESSAPSREHALKAFRLLARESLRRFVYDRVGYSPQAKGVLPPEWVQLNDRLTSNPAPAGYFSVFREISDILLSAIQSGLAIDAKTMPDISVGMLWSKHWVGKKLDATHGTRVKHEHNYPSYFPQRNVVDSWVYPLVALGDFRVWLEEQYLPEKFGGYLHRKAKQGALPEAHVDKLLESVTEKKKLKE